MSETLNIPEGLPSLAAGAHKQGEGKACVMEYVSMLAGEKFSDLPECTHYVLAKTAQNVNDMLGSYNRHLLVPLIGRLFGSSEKQTRNGRSVAVALAQWSAKHAEKSAANANAYAAAANAAAANAANAANANANANAYAANANAANANANAADAAAAAAANANAANAYAANAANAAAAAFAAYAANANANAANARVKFLSELIDEYDRLTGRTSVRDVTGEDLMNLVCELKESVSG